MCGALQQLVYRQKIKNIYHLKQVLNRTAAIDMISHEQTNAAIELTIGLNDCCWTFVRRVDWTQLNMFQLIL